MPSPNNKYPNVRVLLGRFACLCGFNSMVSAFVSASQCRAKLAYSLTSQYNHTSIQTDGGAKRIIANRSTRYLLQYPRMPENTGCPKRRPQPIQYVGKIFLALSKEQCYRHNCREVIRYAIVIELYCRILFLIKGLFLLLYQLERQKQNILWILRNFIK